MTGSRRLTWDEPAPDDLWEHLEEDEGEEDAEQATP